MRRAVLWLLVHLAVRPLLRTVNLVMKIHRSLAERWGLKVEY